MIIAARRLRRAGIAALALCVCAACGKKGPPLAPLRYVPAAATEVKGRRSGNEVRLQFVLPAANAQGQGRIDLDRVEVYAATIAAESPTPPNRDLLVAKYLVGTIAVKPPPQAGESEPPAQAAEDTRPAPGAPATFVEQLNAATLVPQITTPAPPEVLPTQPAAAAAVAAAKEAPVVRRIYVLRGVSRGGRPGPPSARVVLPLTDLPPPPGGVTVNFSEKAVTLTWIPPVLAGPPAAALFNVYAADGTTPLNQAPIPGTSFERAGVVFGTEECFVVRTAVVSGAATVESAPSSRQCVTPVDVFSPAAPQGLSAVGVGGAVNLIWEANAEQDLAGYMILRGEAPGDTLRAITTTPIRDTTYQDTAVQTGVRYVYAVVAVDRATPPNTSPQSARVEESAR